MNGDDNEKIVTFDRGRRRPDPARVREFAETARRLQRERSGAVEIVAQRLAETPLEEWPRLAEDPQMRNSGALEQLAAKIRTLCEREPQEALAISTLATTIAETLPPDLYPPVILAQLRAHAWKDRAHTLRYLGKFEEALESAVTAEKRLEAFPATAHDRAVVWLVKAMILQQLVRFDEAHALLHEASDVFIDHGDSRLYLYCGITQVMLFYREGNYDEGRLLGTKLLDDATQKADRESQARLHNNVGYCEVQLGRVREANIHLSEAKALFIDLGKPIEALRTERGFGALLVTKGHAARGIEVLRSARVDLLDRGLVEEAGMCGLTIAEALIDRGDTSKAHSLVRQILGEFNRANLNQHAIEAMEFLDRAIEVEPSPATVRYVGEYIESLRFNPDRAFVAMPA
jgi:tetratricopeptide (TPR) repeat protein